MLIAILTRETATTLLRCYNLQRLRARRYRSLLREVFWCIPGCREGVLGRVPRFYGPVPGFTDILSKAILSL